MSQVIQLSSNTLAPVAAGLFQLSTGGSNIVLTDMSLFLTNVAAIAAGGVQVNGAIGQAVAGTGASFLPIHTFQVREVAAGAGAVMLNLSFIRYFGSGLILNAGDAIFLDITLFTNLTVLNGTVDFTGFLYN